jgi:hypothetical protein
MKPYYQHNICYISSGTKRYLSQWRVPCAKVVSPPRDFSGDKTLTYYMKCYPIIETPSLLHCKVGSAAPASTAIPTVLKALPFFFYEGGDIL